MYLKGMHVVMAVVGRLLSQDYWEGWIRYLYPVAVQDSVCYTMMRSEKSNE